LNLDEKTIIYIPNVNSAESTKEKLYEVDQLVDIIGTFDHVDENNIYHIITSTGKELKVADLVTPGSDRDKVQNYLRNMKNVDDIDWEWLKRVLTGNIVKPHSLLAIEVL